MKKLILSFDQLAEHINFDKISCAGSLPLYLGHATSPGFSQKTVLSSITSYFFKTIHLVPDKIKVSLPYR